MSKRLQGKVAIVVGAGSSGPGCGTGKASAVLFAREGARVLAVDLNEGAAAETKAIVDREGGVCEIFQADASSARDSAATVDACLARFGRLDVLHVNVGVVELGGPVETPESDWDRLMAVNAKSVYLATKHALPVMERQGSGAIVTVSSLAAIRYPGFPQASYVASKSAVIGLTQNIALAYAAKGIRANCILPGLLDTPMIVKPMRAAYGGAFDAMIEKRNAQSPTGKMGDAWDIAHAALFLASDEAKYVNGVALPVDGGLACKFA
jgi:NAD(P)-dependent dehydrogenase (short-subunit alcohol dehydrogenase family)